MVVEHKPSSSVTAARIAVSEFRANFRVRGTICNVRTGITKLQLTRCY